MLCYVQSSDRQLPQKETYDPRVGSEAKSEKLQILRWIFCQIKVHK